MKIEVSKLETPALHELLSRSIAPLPIALISTVGENGVYNAAPFSLVAPVSWKPPIVCVSIGLRAGQKKRTLRNIEASRDFIINIMDESQIKPTVQASADYPTGVDKVKEIGLTAIAADRVKSPRFAEAQVSLECQLIRKLELNEGQNLRTIVFGEVVLVHVKDELWVAGQIEPSRLRTVGRLGNGIYCRTRDIFQMMPSPYKVK